jgi:hypothetical protein
VVVKELFAKLGLEVDGKAFEVGESLIKGLERGLVATTLAVVGVIGGLAEMGRETAAAASAASKAAQRVGVTTDAIQELNFAAEASGVPVENLETALFRMSNAAYMAKHGSAEAAQAFHGLLTAADLKDSTPDEMLEKMADGFLRIKDPTERAHKVMQIFGRGGKELIPLLNKGSEGIARFREEAHEFGVVLSEEDIKKAKEFRLEMHLLEARVEGLRNKIGLRALDAMRAFGKAVGSATKAIKAFYSTHADGIFQSVKVAVIALAAATSVWVASNLSGLALVAASYIYTGAAAVASAAATIAAWVVAAAPFLAVAAAVAVVYLWFEDLYYFLTGGESVIGDFVNYFKSEWTGLWDFLKDLGRWLVHIFFGDFILGQVDKAAKYIVDKLTGAWKTVKAFFTGGGAAVAGATINAATAPNGFSAGASSPSASVGNSVNTSSPGAPKVVAPTMGVNIAVHAAPGMDSKEVAGQVRTALEDWHDKKMREALEAP